MKVLIAYATKHGSTAEVAHGIAETLRRDRFDVDVVEARHVHRVSGYDGVIVGGSIYVGKWHPDALGLVNRHADEMKRIPVAIFALGPKTLEEHDIATSRAQLDAALAKATNIDPSASRSSAASSTHRRCTSHSTGCLRQTRATGTRSRRGLSSSARSYETGL